MDSREVTRDIRHDIAEALLSEGVEWTGLHDHAIDSPIERHVHPLCEQLETTDASLARLRADLEITRDVLAQTHRALVAERAARVRAEGDAAKMRWALDGMTRIIEDRCSNNPRGAQWMRNVIDANQQVLMDHPGAPLLAELDAARKVVEAARCVVTHKNRNECAKIDAALIAYDAAREGETS